MRELSHDADFDEEVKLTITICEWEDCDAIQVKKTYGKYGVEGLLEKIDAWKNQPVKIAVTFDILNFNFEF